jgi:hypothetical protein
MSNLSAHAVSDILKRTEKNQPDFEDLTKAIIKVEDVMK